MRVFCTLLLGCLLACGLTAGAADGASSRPRPGWLWPLHPLPAVVTGFDPPDHPYGPGHRGVDLAGSVGQQVRSVAAGEVSFARPVAGRPVIVVDHGRLRTTYEPVLSVVDRGDRVGAGQVLGTLTAIGSHCLPLTCLHLGVREGESYLDPLLFLSRGPVRLLPLEPRPTSTPPRVLLPAGFAVVPRPLLL